MLSGCPNSKHSGSHVHGVSFLVQELWLLMIFDGISRYVKFYKEKYNITISDLKQKIMVSYHNPKGEQNPCLNSGYYFFMRSLVRCKK